MTSCKKNCSKIHSYEKLLQSFFTIIMLAHYIPFAPSCFSNTLSLCNGPKVDTFIPIWASSQPYCKIVMKLIPNFPNCNWRPSLNESCPCSFFNGPSNCSFNNNQSFNCPFGLLFFLLAFSNLIYLGHYFWLHNVQVLFKNDHMQHVTIN